MSLPVPTPIEGESLQAVAAFKAYCADPKPSIRRCARRLGKSPTIIARWSKKHHWQRRLIELEAQAALAENERAAQADAAAKKETALLIERERLRFVRRQITASERATEVALLILNQPIGDVPPDHASRLLAVGHSIGAAAMNLPGSNLNVQGLAPTAPNIVVHLTRDSTSDKVQRIQYEFMKAHREHPQAARFIAQYEAEYGRPHDQNGETSNNVNGE